MYVKFKSNSHVSKVAFEAKGVRGNTDLHISEERAEVRKNITKKTQPECKTEWEATRRWREKSAGICETEGERRTTKNIFERERTE